MTGTGDVERVSDWLWELPQRGAMRVPGRVYASAELMAELRGDPCLEQVRNVATLPGIVGWSLAMPDIHWGYGFPIGGVAAFDPAEGGVISPGGVGFDINCLEGSARVLCADGYTRPIREVVESQARARSASVDLERRQVEAAPVCAGMARPPRRPVLEIVTVSGRALSATEDHPVLTPEGMREAGTLAPGARVAVLPFDGVPYEAPPDDVIVSEADVVATAERLGRSNQGNALTQALRRLRPLLPLTYDHPALPALLKVAGYVLGDGTIYFEKDRMKGRVVVYGALGDLERMRADLSPWFRASSVYSRQRQHRIETAYGPVEFEFLEHCARLGSTGLTLLLAALGVPVGVKTTQDWRLPPFLERAPLWQRRLFLAGFFGAELTTPAAFARRNRNFKCPVLTVVKRDGHVESGVAFLEDVARELAAFGVRSQAVSDRMERVNPDGSQSVRLRLVISDETESLLALWGRIGFECNAKRSAAAARAVAYLQQKQAALERRDEARQRVLALRAEHGWGARRIHAAVGAGSGVNFRFIERTLYDRPERQVRTAQAFPAFAEWLHDATEGLGDTPLVWEGIARIRPRDDVDRVYDLTVEHRDHNFVANGFVVHNCGVRLLSVHGVRQKLAREHRGELAAQILRDVPAGTGRGGALKLKAHELDHVSRGGAHWAVERGFGLPEDLAHIEEGGCAAWADPEPVSADARKRGADQLGTLGSGNHFIEVQAVEEIYDAEAAARLGLEPDGLTVLIHTGSRGFGHQVCDDFLDKMLRASRTYGIELADKQLCAAPFHSLEGQSYFGAMGAAMNFAFANRQVITHRVREVLERKFGERVAARVVYDVCHNIAKRERHVVDGRERELVVHRKGATRAFGPGHPMVPPAYRDVGQPVLVPGDMGRYSFVLVGTAKAGEETFGSCCHGAGRRLSRHKALEAARGRDIRRELAERGVSLQAASMRGAAEEISDAYKDVAQVVDVVARAGLARLVAKLRPFVVVKG